MQSVCEKCGKEGVVLWQGRFCSQCYSEEIVVNPRKPLLPESWLAGYGEAMEQKEYNEEILRDQDRYSDLETYHRTSASRIEREGNCR